MGTAYDPFQFPENWDVVTIGGVNSPGVCVVSDAENEGRWDIKDGAGDGATTTFKGRMLAEPKIMWTLWTQDMFREWQGWAFDHLNFDPVKGRGKAIDVYHPTLEAAGIRSLVVKKIGQIVFDKSSTWVTVTVECIEYRPPGKSNPVKTPDGSKGNSGGKNNTKPPTAETAEDEQIRKLKAQYNFLPDTLQ